MSECKTVHARDLVPGQAYRITIDDCCVYAVIDRATFVGKEPYEDGSGDLDDYFYVRFDGVFLTDWNACKFEPVKE